MAVALGTLFELRLDHFGGNSASTDDSSVAEGLTAAALAALELGGCAADAADAADATATDGGDGTAREAASSSSSSSSTGPTCIACGVGVAGAPGFASAEEQRSHFSLDWHRYNVKRRVAGQAPVGEAQFAALLEEDERALEVGSISGSESEADSDDEDDDDGDEGVGAGGAAGPQFAWTAPGGWVAGCLWWRVVGPRHTCASSATCAAYAQRGIHADACSSGVHPPTPHPLLPLPQTASATGAGAPWWPPTATTSAAPPRPRLRRASPSCARCGSAAGAGRW